MIHQFYLYFNHLISFKKLQLINKKMSLKEFKIISKLGQGAYSSVYKVQRIQDSQQYALKKVKLQNLSQKEQQNALNQVRILASIHHQNIIGYKQAFLQGNSLCIVMEFANDGDLYQKIVQHKNNSVPFQQKQIWNVLVQVTRALKILHQLKIYHRDLKSANVFLNKDGLVKLGDMNVSKIAKNGLLYTQTGTPYYASPEVWKDQPYDSKSDLWSLGCVIYQMATLKPPFRAEDMEGLFKKVIKGVYSKIPNTFSQQLSTTIRGLLQVNPNLRPSAQKLLNSTYLKLKIQQLNIRNESQAENQLLKTIKIPKNLHYLTDRLPKANYSTLKTKSLGKASFSDPIHQTSPQLLPKIQNILNQGVPYNEKQKKRRNKNIPPLQIEGHSKIIQGVHKINSHLQNEINMQLNKIYKAKQYKSKKIDYKPSNRNISLPPIQL